MKKNTLTIVGVIAALALSVTALINNPKTTEVVTLGGVSSPDISSPYFSVGSVRQWFGRSENLAQSTTTICAIQSPISTSSLSFAHLRLSVSSTSASIVTIAKSATAFSTTTALSRLAVAANAQATHFASTTVGSTATIFAPNEYVVFSMEGGVGVFSPTGVCQAGWVQI